MSAAAPAAHCLNERLIREQPLLLQALPALRRTWLSAIICCFMRARWPASSRSFALTAGCVRGGQRTAWREALPGSGSPGAPHTASGSRGAARTCVPEVDQRCPLRLVVRQLGVDLVTSL